MAEQVTQQPTGDLMQQLAALLQQRGPAPAAPFGAPPAPFQQTPFTFGAQPAAQLQPTGIAIPVSIPLPDGREMVARLMFGPEVLANWQGFVQMLLQQYGGAIKAYPPRQQGFQQGGGGWNGGGSYGRGRGRW